MDITQRPKGPSKNAAEIKPAKYVDRVTLKRVFTADESKNYLVKFLKELATEKGPWAEYWTFYTQNMSGEIESMSPEHRKYVERFVKEVSEEYSKRKA